MRIRFARVRSYVSIKRSILYINFVIGILIISVSEMLWVGLGSKITEQLVKNFPFTGFDAVELRDKLSIAILVALIPICALSNFQINSEKQKKNFILFAEIPASILLFASIGWKTYYRADQPQVMWEGFGFLIMSFLVILVLLSVTRQNFNFLNSTGISSKISSFLQALIVVFIIIFYLPSVINIPNGVTSIGAIRWSLNEIIAPIVGKFPLVNFTSEYSSLLGFPLLIIKWAIPNDVIPFVATLYMSLLIIIQYLITAWIINKVLPHVSYLCCLFAACSISLVQHSANKEFSSSIIAALTATPSRTLIPILGLASLILWHNKSSGRLAALTGSLSVLGMINNVEFGLWFCFAVFAVVAWSHVCRNDYFAVASIKYFYFSLPATLFLYLTVAYAVAGPFDPKRYLVFVRAFGKNDFGSIPMPKFGLYIFIFSLLALSASVALKASNWMRNNPSTNKSENISVIVGLVIGVWSSFSLLYYAGRSTNAGQLQIFLIPLPIAISVIVQLCKSQTLKPIDLKKLFFHSPPLILLISFLGLVTVFQAPSPFSEFSRLKNGNYEWTIDSVINSPEGAAMLEFIKQNPEKKLGYFGRNGNLVELSLPIENASTINYPYDLWMSPLIEALACADISPLHFEIIVVPRDDLPENEVEQFCAGAGLKFSGLDPSNRLYIYDLTK